MRSRSDEYESLRLKARRLIESDRRLVDELVSIRRRRGVTDDEMCRRMGVDLDTLSEIESGFTDQTLGQIRRYAHAVGAVVEHVVHESRPHESADRGPDRT